MKKLVVLMVLGILLFGCTQNGQQGYGSPPSQNSTVPTQPANGSMNSSPTMNESPVMNETNQTGSMNASTNMSSNNSALWGGEFDTPGNVLISDQFNNRIVEVNPATNKIVWSFGSNNPGLCNPGPGTIIGSNWAERLSGGRTVIAGTGIPAGADPLMNDGCADNRVIVVDKTGNIVWQYGQANVTGSGPNELNVPVSAVELQNGDFLITDQGNNRILEVNSTKEVVWSYAPAAGPGALNSPNSAELLDNGHILIADENNNRTIEITRNGTIVWEYDTELNTVAFASRLPDGNTLVDDSGNARILIVTPDKQVVFQYHTNTGNDSNAMPLPTNAVEFGNANIMVADEYNHRVFAINPQKQVIWQYGMTNVSGNGTNQLNGPYTAFVIGDYTGQTLPPGVFSLSSPAFANGDGIPAQFTCEGANTNPPLMLSNVPAGTKSLALIVYDVDATFVHWVAWNFNPTMTEIPGTVSGVGIEGANGLAALNYTGSWPTGGYIGPCPPPGNAHRYYFRAYALDSILSQRSGNMSDLQNAMAGHMLGEANLVGLYKCSKSTAAADGLCR